MPEFLRRRSGVTGAIVLVAGALALVSAGVRQAPPRAAQDAFDSVPATSHAAAARTARLSPAPAAPRSAQAGPVLLPGAPLRRPGRSAAGPLMLSPANGVITSTNWGGYLAQRSGTTFRFVQATFFVPYLDCPGTPGAYSAHWVGLDGAPGSTTVEQAGVLAYCKGSSPVYSAWYEMFPRYPVYPAAAVHPGDSIVASMYYQQSSHHFVASLTDTTDGRGFRRVMSCPSGSACRRASAEVISEAPSARNAVLPLANFRALGFTRIAVTDLAGHRGSLRSRYWDTARITTVDSTGRAVLDQPTSLYRGSMFSNYWMASQ